MGEQEIVSQEIHRSRIVVGSQWAPSIQQVAPKRWVIVDQQLPHGQALGEALAAHRVLRLPAGEAVKTLQAASQLYQWFGETGVTRDGCIVAIGGGTLTDLVGYAAATYLRGIGWCAVPTTLLAQVDAAIGGKVGVNTAWGKNLVGAFHLPEVVAVDLSFLETLPVHGWRDGLGEILKSALIAGEPLFGWLEQLQLPSDPPVSITSRWWDIVETTIKIKVDIVNQDMRESGPRMYVNFGHTIAHAVETLTGYNTYSHGEAVGLGALAALRLSEMVYAIDPAIFRAVKAWMKVWGMPTVLPKLSFDALWEQLYRDKKARTEGLTWVLLKQLGVPVLHTNLDRALVAQVVHELS